MKADCTWEQVDALLDLAGVPPMAHVVGRTAIITVQHIRAIAAHVESLRRERDEARAELDRMRARS